MTNEAFNRLRHDDIARSIVGRLEIVQMLFFKYFSIELYGSDDMPLTVSIETVSKCTRSCSYCPVGSIEFRSSRKVHFMSDLVFTQCINQLASFPSRRSIGFQGTLNLSVFGEPLLDPQLVDRARKIRDTLPGASIYIYSNGDLITPKYVSELKKAGVTGIMLTPHSGKFSQNVIEAQQKYKDILTLNKVLTKFFNRGGAVKIEPEELIEQPKTCIPNAYSMAISSSGDVTMCCNDPYLTRNFGNVTNSTLLEIWQRDEFKRLRKSLKDGDSKHYPQVCLNCKGV